MIEYERAILERGIAFRNKLVQENPTHPELQLIEADLRRRQARVEGATPSEVSQTISLDPLISALLEVSQAEVPTFGERVQLLADEINLNFGRDLPDQTELAQLFLPSKDHTLHPLATFTVDPTTINPRLKKIYNGALKQISWNYRFRETEPIISLGQLRSVHWKTLLQLRNVGEGTARFITTAYQRREEVTMQPETIVNS